MAFEIWEGPPRSGKSYTVVNRLLAGWLRNTKRHVYHNLPLNLDRFLVSLARTSAVREEYRSRLHELVGGEEREAFGPDGASLGMHDPVREFWFFCPQGAVIILDETAEEFGALDRKGRSEFLQPVFNRQGHFGWDLVFICQDIRDVDVQIRRKAHFIYCVRNSTKEPIFPWPLFSGIFWPVQFFIVRQYDGHSYGEKRSGELLDYFVVWPRAWGFRTYRSFTHSRRLAWIAPKPEGEESGDMKTTGTRIRESLWRAKRLFIFGAIAAALFFGGIWALKAIARLGTSKEFASSIFGLRSGTNAVPARGSNVVASAVGASNGVPATAAQSVGREKLKFVTGAYVRTDKAVYVVGSSVGSNRVARIYLDGFGWAGGGSAGFRELFD